MSKQKELDDALNFLSPPQGLTEENKIENAHYMQENTKIISNDMHITKNDENFIIDDSTDSCIVGIKSNVCSEIGVDNHEFYS